jgi:hypothetical protein
MWGRNRLTDSNEFWRRESADIINPTEVYVDRFRGFELTRGQLKSCCSRVPVILSKFSSEFRLDPLLPLVLMLYYWNSRVIKQQITSQANKVFGVMCAWRLKLFVVWSSGTRLAVTVIQWMFSVWFRLWLNAFWRLRGPHQALLHFVTLTKVHG